MRPTEAAVVLEALDDASPEVRRRARVARAAFGAPSAREVLEEALLDPEPELRATAAELLGRLGRREATAALARALGDGTASVRIAAARALGALGGEDAVRALQHASRRGDLPLRAASLEALGAVRAREGALPASEEGPSGGGARTSRAAGFSLEKVFSGAGGGRYCLLRPPDGGARILGPGDEAGEGFVVRAVLPREGGGGRVILARGESVVTLDVGQGD
jgi:HEAT repeat protein